MYGFDFSKLVVIKSTYITKIENEWPYLTKSLATLLLLQHTLSIVIHTTSIINNNYY